MIEALIGVARRGRRVHAANRTLEERVTGEDVVAVDAEVEHPVRVPRRVQADDREAAD
jgi:hypothetical protein